MTEIDSEPVSETRRDRWFQLALVAVCLIVTAGTAVVLEGRDGVRNPDEAAYAQQAESMLEGRGLLVDSIRHYHVQKPRDITHPEDFYPPGNGALIAASWSVFGRSDKASAYPSMLIAGLLMPLLAAALALRLGASWPFAFGAGVSVLFEPLIRFQSIQGLADLPLSGAVLGATVLALGSTLRSAILCGVVLGLGFWFKPAGLLFAPAIGLAVLLSRPRTEEFPPKRALFHFLGFSSAFLLVCAPWMIRNLQLFGDPIYSGNKYLTASANDPEFSFADVRKVYWADGDSSAVEFGESVSSNLGFAINRFVSHLKEVVEIHGASMFGFAFVLAAIAFARERRIRAMTALCLTYVVALSAVFAIFDRYLMPLFPITMAMSWLVAGRVAERLRGSTNEQLPGAWLLAHPSRLALCLAALAAVPQGLPWAKEVLVGKTNFVRPSDDASIDSANWAKANLPKDAVVMANEALRFHHITGLKTVNTPWDDPDAIERVVQHYRVDTIVRCWTGDSTTLSDPAIARYLRVHSKNWKQIPVEAEGFLVWSRRPE